MPTKVIERNKSDSERVETKTVKCWSCARDAVVMANCCSPTSSTGVTETKPRCGDCFGSMYGANVISFLVPVAKATSEIRLGAARMACRDHFFKNHMLNGKEKEGCFDHMIITEKSVKCKDCGTKFPR